MRVQTPSTATHPPLRPSDPGVPPPVRPSPSNEPPASGQASRQHAGGGCLLPPASLLTWDGPSHPCIEPLRATCRPPSSSYWRASCRSCAALVATAVVSQKVVGASIAQLTTTLALLTMAIVPLGPQLTTRTRMSWERRVLMTASGTTGPPFGVFPPQETSRRPSSKPPNTVMPANPLAGMTSNE